MDFTREPIIETVITAKDGHRIVVRSSKNPGQEEFFVDALEVVSFGHSCFFRSLERPRAFIVPTSDYEVLEVREPRLPLKTPSIEGMIKIGAASNKGETSRSQPSGRDRGEERHERREARDQAHDRREREQKGESGRDHERREAAGERRGEKDMNQGSGALAPSDAVALGRETTPPLEGETSSLSEQRLSSHTTSVHPSHMDRKRDRRRGLRRRRGAREDARHEESQTPYNEEAMGQGGDTANGIEQQAVQGDLPFLPEESILPPPSKVSGRDRSRRAERNNEQASDAGENGEVVQPSTLITSILPPPTTLIRDDLARLRNNELYKGAFYIREQESFQEEAAKKEEEDDDDFLMTSSLRFDDDDDVNSNAYMASPAKGKAPAAQKKEEAHVQEEKDASSQVVSQEQEKSAQE